MRGPLRLHAVAAAAAGAAISLPLIGAGGKGPVPFTSEAAERGLV